MLAITISKWTPIKHHDKFLSVSNSFTQFAQILTRLATDFSLCKGTQKYKAKFSAIS